jgi:hypothetical protein
MTSGSGPRTPSEEPTRAIAEAQVRAGHAAVLVDGESWRQVDDLHRSGPDDRHFTVSDDGTGGPTVTFGDGTSGARLPTDATVITVTYRTGAGSEGNAPDADSAITLVETVAFIADVLSRYQDAVSNEAYLETARDRVSVRDRSAVRAALDRAAAAGSSICVCVQLDRREPVQPR